jgi:hypothetical protein
MSFNCLVWILKKFFILLKNYFLIEFIDSDRLYLLVPILIFLYLPYILNNSKVYIIKPNFRF